MNGFNFPVDMHTSQVIFFQNRLTLSQLKLLNHADKNVSPLQRLLLYCAEIGEKEILKCTGNNGKGEKEKGSWAGFSSNSFSFSVELELMFKVVVLGKPKKVVIISCKCFTLELMPSPLSNKRNSGSVEFHNYINCESRACLKSLVRSHKRGQEDSGPKFVSGKTLIYINKSKAKGKHW